MCHFRDTGTQNDRLRPFEVPDVCNARLKESYRPGRTCLGELDRDLLEKKTDILYIF